MTGELTAIAPGVAAWISPPGRGATNSAVLVDDDGLTVVDCLLTPRAAEPLAAACADLGVLVRRLVLTSSHAAYVGGSSLFRLAAVYGTAETSAMLDQPPNVSGCQHLYPDHASDLAELAEVGTRPVSHVVREPAWISASAVAVPLAGEQAENLVVQVPAVGVVLAGAVCSFGTTPLAFAADLEAWATSLDTLVTYGSVIVPGQGPVGGEPEVRALQGYLRACLGANGDPARLPSGPWDEWSGRELDVVNVERAALLARGDRSPPPSMLRMLGM